MSTHYNQLLDVALVYNVKPEGLLVQQSNEDEILSPSTNSVSASILPETKNIHNDMYAEWDTFDTILAVQTALATQHHVTLLEANEEVFEQLRTLSPQIVFNIAEGMNGVSREAHIPAMLEFLNIPFTGSGSLTLASCLDKSRTKEILSYHNIPTASFCVIENLSQLSRMQFSFPQIVKPLHEGSSKGIYNSCVVHTKHDLFEKVKNILSQYQQPALVEKYLQGREFTVAMLGNGENVRALPIVEINFDSLPLDVNPIYSFEAKWIWDTTENPLDIYECPANISSSLQNEIEVLCKKTFNVLRCRDWCRIDVRLDEHHTANILELNPLPGILPNPNDNSCFPKSARVAGMTYEEMLNTVLDEACIRYEIF